LIAVVHAYSRVNAGDGLLVDLTLRRLARIGVNPEDCVVVAMDPASFADLAHVVKLGTAGRALDRETAFAAVRAFGVAGGALRQRLALGAAARTLAAADGYVAVGGGYLRTGNRVNAVGTAINHLPQLLAVARSNRPSVYLPQSIGPLNGPVGRAVRATLRRVGQVHVRDDRSLDALGGAPNVRRTPDLAVLDVADQLAASRPRDAAGTPIIVARALRDAAEYADRLHGLARLLGDVAWGVQAEGSAQKSDRTFYETLAVTPDGRVTDLLAQSPGPVISVRLHGALQAIMAGVPAVHLGYERKSWGAYEDLGLSTWVHSARRFDPEAVADQVRALRADPEPFWTAIHARAKYLQDESGALDEHLTAALKDVG
jgi:polysaccharide pyruvyl transferase WcaK-like protein